MDVNPCLQHEMELHPDIKDNTESPTITGSIGSTEMVEMEQIRCDSVDIDEKELVKRYLGIFDEAMEAIISLIRQDSLPRFYQTKAYETMKMAQE